MRYIDMQVGQRVRVVRNNSAPVGPDPIGGGLVGLEGEVVKVYNSHHFSDLEPDFALTVEVAFDQAVEWGGRTATKLPFEPDELELVTEAPDGE